jgi:hypothetical protein
LLSLHVVAFSSSVYCFAAHFGLGSLGLGSLTSRTLRHGRFEVDEKTAATDRIFFQSRYEETTQKEADASSSEDEENEWERERQEARRRAGATMNDDEKAQLRSKGSAEGRRSCKFSSRAIKAAATPTVPRAADAAKHVPGGGSVEIYNKKHDVSHVQSKVVMLTRLDKAPHAASSAVAASTDVNAAQSVENSPDLTPPATARHKAELGAVLHFSKKKTYEHVSPKVPRAHDALSHVPAGGHVILPSPPQMKWQHHGVISPVVPTAAQAASVKLPERSIKPIFQEKVSFSKKAQAVAVPISARDAAHYKPAGGEVDVFLWRRRSGETARRRASARKSKTEEQTFQEFFPTARQELDGTLVTDADDSTFPVLNTARTLSTQKRKSRGMAPAPNSLISSILRTPRRQSGEMLTNLGS